MTTDCIIAGGGVVGAAVLDALTLAGYGCVLFEKEDDVASGASRANSGVSHAGYDAPSGSAMARFNVEGNAMMPALCRDLDVPFINTGSLVLAPAGREGELEILYERGRKNGVDVRIVGREEMDAIQPGIPDAVSSALYARDAGVVSPFGLTLALCERAVRNGAEVRLNEAVTGISRTEKGFLVKTEKGEYESSFFVNAAGAYASDVNAMIGEERYETAYRKGEYFVLDKTENAAVRTVMFPLPDERGKGILVAPTADGNVLCGPTSVPCERDDVSVTAAGLAEAGRGAALLFPRAASGKTIRQYAGVRSAVGKDFIIKESAKFPGFIILAGICSPGLTAAPAIGKHVAELICAKRPAKRLSDPVLRLSHRAFSSLSDEEVNEQVERDPSAGRIVCRCEKVTEAEIVAAIHSPIPATTVDAVKRRVRAGMGRCQGGFCAPRVIGILSRELGIPVTEVKKGGEGSNLAACRIKEVSHD